MADVGAVKKKRLALLLVVAVILGGVTFVLRGPYVSDALMKVILPELRTATGQRVTCRRIYVNLFPLFAGVRNMQVSDQSGTMLLSVPSAKAYIDPSGLFSRRVVIRRLVINGPEIATDRKQVEEIIGNVRTYLSRKRKTAVKVEIRTLAVRHGRIVFTDEPRKLLSKIEGLNGEILMGAAQRINVSAERVSVKAGNWPELFADVSTSLLVKDGKVKIKRFVAGSLGSKVSGSGEYSGNKATIRTSMELLFSTVKKLFSLERDGTGKLSAKGIVSYANGKVGLDLKMDGHFYIQTLMEFLKVKENIEGFVDVKGEVKGPLDDLRGEGTLSVKNGDFYNVDVDSMKCKVTYAKGEMRFTDGAGRLYNGQAKVDVMIHLPVVNYYTVAVDFRDIDSAPMFRLIGWDPGVEPGKLTGTLKTAGSAFNPEGSFNYRSLRQGRDLIGRIRNIASVYSLQNHLLTLSGLKVSTGLTRIEAAGTVDLGRKSLDIKARMKTADVTDASLPYYDKLKGAGEFGGKVTGSFDDPVISGHLRILKPVFDSYTADVIEGNLEYRKEEMTVSELSARGKDETVTVEGGIDFRTARKLFDLSGAEYHLSAAVRNADMGRFVKIFDPEFAGTGSLRGDVKIAGKAENPHIEGRASVENGSVYGVPFDALQFALKYAAGKLGLSNLRLSRGKSVVTGDVGFGQGGSFSFRASSERLLLSDLLRRKINGDAVFSVKAEGSGTFDNPSVSMSGRIMEGVLRGRNIGGGSIEASIKDKVVSVRAGMMNDGLRFTGKGRFGGEMPWEGRIDIVTGRYDPLVSAFLKDAPEDLILSLDGTILLRGDRHHVSATADLKQVVLSMYGYSFSNEKEIQVSLNDRTLAMNRFSLRSGDAVLSVDGSLVLGKEYNLVFEGKTALSPFKSLSSRIALLRGNADFVLSVSGDWDNPQMNGGATLSDGAVGMKDLPYRVVSLNGYVYMDNDRLVLQSLNGKTGGGDVHLSGIVYLKKFSFARFYVDAKLTNITTSFSGGFNMNFGGNLLLGGTPSSQKVSGDITINRARYRGRVEWKSWLLKIKKTEGYRGEISGIEKAGLDVRITGSNILVDNNIARASVGADLVLRGTLYRPVLLGRIETKEGTVFFRNNDFRILHASADFTDPSRMNPYFMISADTLVKGYRITLNLDGQFDHFNLSLTSDPVLKEMDILSLLAVGQTSTEMKGLEGSMGASEATGFVTGKLQDVLEERLKTITGLDRFQIDPYVSKTTGTVEPRVTVSKRLIGDKLYVTYATAVGTKEDQIVKLEYLLTRHMSLVGVRDERGIVGADLTFRFRFK